MKITHLSVPPDRAAHIARHSVTREEVWEAAFNDPRNIVQRLKATTPGARRRIYRLLGRTEAGRYLAVIFIYRGRGQAYLVTARDMTEAERRYYHEKER
ncbi:MAG: BrnT family toxin [Moorellales bacterium]